jgi:hypothetical protein
MAIVMKNEVLRVKEKFKMIQEIENGKKKTDVCQEIGLINSVIQIIWKNRNRIISGVARNGPRIKQFRKPE